jgi:amino acid transporter
MKQCPRCNKTYTDENLNFCLEDGEMLTVMAPHSGAYLDDPPPTMIMNEARVTNPVSWQQPSAPPPAVYQGQPMMGQYNMPMTPNQTLAIVSLCLGIGSVTIGWCCYIGVLLSPAAIITGFIALSQIKKDPQRNGGRGLAIGGIVTGLVYIAIVVLVVILYGAAIF